MAKKNHTRTIASLPKSQVQKTSTSQIDPRSLESKHNAFQQALELVSKSYLAHLPDYELLPFVEDDVTQNYSRFFALSDIVYAKDEDFLQKAVTILYTAYALEAAVVVILSSDGVNNRYLMGISAPNDSSNVSDKFSSFHRAIQGNFSVNSKETQQQHNLSNEQLKQELTSIFAKDNSVVTSISGIPALRKAEKHSITNFIQGIENLTDALRGSVYSLMIQATPISSQELRVTRQAYEQIHTSLSPYSKTECNYNLAEMEGQSENITHQQGKSSDVSDSSSIVKTTGSSTSNTEGSSTSKSVNNGAIAAGLVVAGAAVAVLAAPYVAGASALGTVAAAETSGGTAATAVAAAGASGIASAIGGGIGTKTTTKNTAKTETKTENTATGNTTTSRNGTNESIANTNSINSSITAGQSIQYSVEDKAVINIQAVIDENLKRLQLCENYGTFESCAYVLSNSVATNQCVASLYEALMRGDTSYTQGAHIHTWSDDMPQTIHLKKYLQHLHHPRFAFPVGNTTTVITPALMVSGEELALQIGLPKKSVPGITVRQCAEFGCNPPNQINSADFQLGKLYRMGANTDIPTPLSINSLCSHTFITGSTGSGKSNTVYHMLGKLSENNIKFMVIEPAKGEYKYAFGGRNDVTLYGTNPYKSPNLLQINPFYFPKDIHVLEHIDRLVEIFNACWPMYAAMPAILKESIEQAYVNCGWNLRTSHYINRFPSFDELLQVLPQVIDSSSYSSDTSSDYKGALVTRVRSLTRGIYGQVFDGDIDNNDLFNQNTIIDLSRVGSQETKALIMGILVLKLQEYRMSEKVAPNTPLRHITVLEEAHNLLRRTSSEQSQESSNLQGKSVEMIANAIAEMRTYGQGFIIADQSPGLMDMSVIRNTNTKIIMRLPDQEDRNLVGKAASLNEDQIIELAKLEVGVAAVHQNNWLEPVLCKVHYYQSLNAYKDKEYSWEDHRQSAIQHFLQKAFALENRELSEDEVDQIRKWKGTLHLSNKKQQVFEAVLANKTLTIDGKMLILFGICKLDKSSTRSDMLCRTDQVLTSMGMNENVCEIANRLILENITETMLRTEQERVR